MVLHAGCFTLRTPFLWFPPARGPSQTRTVSVELLGAFGLMSRKCLRVGFGPKSSATLLGAEYSFAIPFFVGNSTRWAIILRDFTLQ